MTTANESSTGVPLDYGQQPSHWDRFYSALHDRFYKWWESLGYFLGMAVYLAGGPRQMMLAFGLAFLAGGFGLAIEGPQISTGHFWMWIGGFLIGLIVPLPKPRAKQ